MNDKVIELIPELLRELRNDVGDINRKLDRLSDDTRAGFASTRSHLEAQQRDINNIERRFDRLEDDLRMLQKTVDFPTDGPFDA